MLTDVWPLFGLVLRTPRLELRVPSLEQLAALAELAEEGVHDPAEMPFLVPWTDLPPGPRGRSVMQYQWRPWGELTPERWSLELAVLAGGEPVGIQGIGGTDFAVTREVHTGSWLGRRHHGRGIGTEMRAAVLHLAFAGLGRRLGGLVGPVRQCGLDRRLPQARLRRRRHRGAGRARAAPDRPAVPDRPGDLGRPADRAGADRGTGAVPGAARRAQPGRRARRRSLSTARSIESVNSSASSGQVPIDGTAIDSTKATSRIPTVVSDGGSLTQSSTSGRSASSSSRCRRPHQDMPSRLSAETSSTPIVERYGAVPVHLGW